jgi:hypothetical protein
MEFPMSIPQVEEYLPELIAFVNRLVESFESGELNSWPIMTEKVQTFFTQEKMDKVEKVIPGWRAMSGYLDGATLVHVLSVLTALLMCPEYKQTAPDQQALMKWIVLFHDLAKLPQEEKRDHPHAFRSAARTGVTLPELGFTVQDDKLPLSDLALMTETAITKHTTTHENIQDNRKLPDIIGGIEKIFGAATPATLIVKTVLLHMAIDVVADWPQAAPLTDREIQQYVDSSLLPLLRIMMIVDNEAWALFDPVTKQRYREETLTVFRQMAARR